jgi:hypothetical protein
MEITITTTGDKIFVKDKIGFVRNNWRQRNVEIWDHPEKSNKVITIGRSFDGKSVICCIENRANWTQYIGKYNTVLN